MSKYILQIKENGAMLSKSFAQHFASQAALAIRDRGRFLVVLSGGSTPLNAYRMLMQEPLKQAVPWQHVHVFWGDERFVQYDDPQSNFGQAKQAFLDHVGIPPENLNPIPTDCSPEEAAHTYSQTLLNYVEAGQTFARFDLVMFGLGGDGHVASLFPGQSALWKDPVIPVQAAYRDRPSIRITMTPLALNHTLEAIFLVSGASKSDALAAALQSPTNVSRFPSHAIKPDAGKVIWMADANAAQKVAC